MRARNDNDLFAAISTLPEVLDLLRHCLSTIERSSDTLQVHLANERAVGVVETLEVLKVLKTADIESLHLIMDDAVQARVTALLL